MHNANLYVLALEDSCPYWMEKGFILEQVGATNQRLNIFPDTHLLKLPSNRPEPLDLPPSPDYVPPGEADSEEDGSIDDEDEDEDEDEDQDDEEADIEEQQLQAAIQRSLDGGGGGASGDGIPNPVQTPAVAMPPSAEPVVVDSTDEEDDDDDEERQLALAIAMSLAND